LSSQHAHLVTVGKQTMVDASTDVAYQRVVVRDGADSSTSSFSDRRFQDVHLDLCVTKPANSPQGNRERWGSGLVQGPRVPRVLTRSNIRCMVSTWREPGIQRRTSRQPSPTPRRRDGPSRPLRRDTVGVSCDVARPAAWGVRSRSGPRPATRETMPNRFEGRLTDAPTNGPTRRPPR